MLVIAGVKKLEGIVKWSRLANFGYWQRNIMVVFG